MLLYRLRAGYCYVAGRAALEFRAEGVFMKNWLGSLLAAIVAGVVIYWLTVGWKPAHTPTNAPGSANSAVQSGPPVAHVPKGGIYVPPPPPAPVVRMTPLEVNTNRQGNDIRWFQVNTAAQCSLECLKDINCKAITFVENPQGGVCWLKNAVPPPTQQPGLISSVKRF